MACQQGPQPKIDAEFYSINPKDQTIYRQITEGQEEFLSCSDPKIGEFVAVRKSVFIKLIGQALHSEDKPK